jgi:hypothetical protein
MAAILNDRFASVFGAARGGGDTSRFASEVEDIAYAPVARLLDWLVALSRTQGWAERVRASWLNPWTEDFTAAYDKTVTLIALETPAAVLARRADAEVLKRLRGLYARSVARGAAHALLYADTLTADEFQVLYAEVARLEVEAAAPATVLNA